MNEQKVNYANENIAPLITKTDVEVFDPPLCCPTGLCGPTIDPTLLDVSEMIAKLQSDGYQVIRYQMSSHPGAFTGNPEVMKLIREKQLAALPIVIVRGKVIAVGAYPTISEINVHLNGGK